MTITRDNYEEFFILYGDNELSSEDRRKVDEFLRVNPDLQMEFDLFSSIKLSPDSSIRFDLKEMLMQSEATSNESLMLYIDDEMDADERQAFEQMISTDEETLIELDRFAKAKLDPSETMVFPYKESLYRTEKEKTRVIPIFWKRMLAVAAVLAAVTITTVKLYQGRQDVDHSFAINGGGKKESPVPSTNSSSTPSTNPSANPSTNRSTSPSSNPSVPPSVLPLKYQLTADDAMANNDGNNKSQVAPKVVTKDKQGVAQGDHKDNKHNDQLAQGNSTPGHKVNKDNNVITHPTNNNLPKPLNNPNVNPGLKQEQVVAKVDRSATDALTPSKQKKQVPSVTPDNDGSLQLAVNRSTDPADDEMDTDQSSRKNKHRGFFRKVTRTFEKNTNIRASDDDRLLVGGLAIRL